jgi:Ala-tRNA(Pro) deacylase
MRVPTVLLDFLKQQRIKFDVVSHGAAFTAQETAHAEHAPGMSMAKVVMLKADGKDVMVVMPAPYRLHEGRMKRLIGARKIRLATEREFRKLFPDCEVGAMPPFGNIYDIPFYVDFSLSQNEHIIFNAGSHRKSIRMSFEDYEKLVNPVLCSFAVSIANGD